MHNVMMTTATTNHLLEASDRPQLLNGFHHSSSTLAPSLSSRSSSQSQAIQNYSPFRRAENEKPSLSNQSNYLRSTLSSQTNKSMEVAKNSQEYSRYRSALRPNSTKSSGLPNSFMSLPYYSYLSCHNENEYSKYRDSRVTRKTSFSRPVHPLTDHLHHHSRSLTYDSIAQRFPVPDNKVFWDAFFADYTPLEYTTERILKNPRADSSDPSTIEKFNQLDKKTDRRSYTGVYQVDPKTNRPQNPMGRTGMTGRGRLYYWGPNHAGDPVVTRWSRDGNGSIIYPQQNGLVSSKPLLEFVAIQRKDTKQWALPGGMVDPGEFVCQTIKREFQEEANRDGIDQDKIDRLFSNGHKIYQWYMDDPRNTDNAWIESVAMHFHDEQGQLTKDLHLNAGDDAEKVVWCPINRDLQLYAGHKEIIRAVVDRLNAYW